MAFPYLAREIFVYFLLTLVSMKKYKPVGIFRAKINP